MRSFDPPSGERDTPDIKHKGQQTWLVCRAANLSNLSQSMHAYSSLDSRQFDNSSVFDLSATTAVKA